MGSYELENTLMLGLINSTIADVSKKYNVTKDEIHGILGSPTESVGVFRP